MTKQISYETFDWVQLDKYLQFKITLKMAAELMECGTTTIKDYIKRKHGMTFTEYSDLKMSKVKVKLVQKALDMAFNGNNALMIFCLKNICGWADKNEVTSTSTFTYEQYVHEMHRNLRRKEIEHKEDIEEVEFKPSGENSED